MAFICEFAQTDVRSEHGLFPGIARDHDTRSKGKPTTWSRLTIKKKHPLRGISQKKTGRRVLRLG